MLSWILWPASFHLLLVTIVFHYHLKNYQQDSLEFIYGFQVLDVYCVFSDSQKENVCNLTKSL